MEAERSPLSTHAASPAELRARIDAERRGAPFLVYRGERDEQLIHELGPGRERVSIGRSAGNDVALGWDEEVSRLHAELERSGDQWTISDDGLSRNGSFVNGGRISGRQRLRDGDVIQIGATRLAFRMPESEDSSPTVAASGTRIPDVTPTQRRVLIALCRPYGQSEFPTPATNQQIADEVHLSIDAVKSHLRALFAAFGLEQLPQNQKRSRLAVEALQLGVVSSREL